MNTFTISENVPVVRANDGPEEPWQGIRVMGDPSLVLFGSDRLPPAAEELAALEEIRRLEGVVRVVGLPDLHLKPLLETPSSVAIATGEAIVLNFSSPSPGCGMALAATGLEERDLHPDQLDRFFAGLVERLSPGGEARPKVDIRRFLTGGAPSAVEYFNVDHQALHAFDGGGNALVWPGLEDAQPDALSVFPEAFLGLAANDFGLIGRGNHFLEMQVVDEVLDPILAQAWGLSVGQVLVMYHADSGRFGAFLGRLYAFRRKNHWRGRMVELRYKTAYHLAQSQGPRQLLARVRDYFMPRRYTFLPARSAAAQQALLALAVGTNYAFANRTAILNGINQALQAAWGQTGGPAALLYDQPHNTIRQEVIEGQVLWVHRHNASRALPAGHPELNASRLPGRQPVLLPGTDRSHSFLCAAGTGTGGSLYSVDHGAGRSALRLGTAQPENASQRHFTRLYGYDHLPPTRSAHISSEGIEEVVRVLDHAELAHPVVRLRPVAGLKDRLRQDRSEKDRSR